MNYGKILLIVGCFTVSMHAMYQSITSDSMHDAQRLLKFNRTANCSMRHRVAYMQWLPRQNTKERHIEQAETMPLSALLGFTTLPTRTSDVDRRVNEILSSPIFCDQIYEDQQAQQMVRSLARDVLLAADIVKSSITNRARAVPKIDSNSSIFSPISSLSLILVNYLIANVPDIAREDVVRVQELISQLIRQADKMEPDGKQMRVQTVATLDKYFRQTMPLLYADEYTKGVNRVPTQEEYTYATKLLSQNKRLSIPKKSSAAIEAWRIHASEFLKSSDYQPGRYKDPEVAHLVKTMVQDINSAVALIKAYIQKKATPAAIQKPSFVDPVVHDQIKEIIKAISIPETMTEEQKDNLIVYLTEQKTKIEQLPPEYQDALKQYINIDERIAQLTPMPTPSIAALKPETKSETMPMQIMPSPTVTTPIPSEQPPTAKPGEEKPVEAAVEAPTEAVQPGVSAQVAKPVELSAASTSEVAGEQPAVPVSPEAVTQPTLVPEAFTPSSLKEALETRGQVSEIAVGKAGVPPVVSVASEASLMPESTVIPTPMPPSVSAEQPSVEAAVTPSYVPSQAQTYETPYEEIPIVTPSEEPIVVQPESYISPETPPTPPVVETPIPSVPPTTPTTPAAPTQATTPSAPSTTSAAAPVTSPTISTGPSVQDSLKELRDQLKRMDVQA